MTGPNPLTCEDRQREVESIVGVIQKMKAQARRLHRLYQHDPCKWLRLIGESIGCIADQLQTVQDLTEEMFPDDED